VYNYIVSCRILLFLSRLNAGMSGEIEMHCYIGTYTDQESDGIYILTFDPETGALGRPRLAAELPNPTFLEFHPSGESLYAISEVRESGERLGGFVTALKIDPESGDLVPMNTESTGAPGPCHVSVHPGGRFVFAVNYSGGSIASFDLNEDGSLRSRTASVRHEGSSVNADRQEGPHPHSINPDPTGSYVLVADLGTDRLYVYRVDEQGGLTPGRSPYFATRPGAGPRHSTFHHVDAGMRVYLINELDNTIDVLSYDDQSGELKHLQNVPTLPADWSGESFTAEIRVHPTGRFLYGSNRGHDSIAVFRIDADSGLLTFVDHTSSGGEFPRNFCIEPSGKFLVVANQDSSNLVVMRIDPESGRLTPTGTEANVSRPVCVRFL
jgi:6-phosphogluconolactonase